MNFIRLRPLFLLTAFLMFQGAQAAVNEVVKLFLPTQSLHANWLFSGVAINESGERYGYFFKMQRNDQTLHALTALVDIQTKQVLLLDEHMATLTDTTQYSWKAGRSFMHFNPINGNWIFGLKTKDKQGFNFKVDLLSGLKNPPIVQEIRPGIELLVGQTGSLNGHIYMGHEKKEQFVTSPSAWFRQVWLSENQRQDKPHEFSGLFCRLDDGGGLYSVNMQESDIHQGAVTGLFDAQGKARPMSQFIDVQRSQADDHWHIRIQTPAHHLILSDLIQGKSVAAGFVTYDEQSAFCIVTNDVLGESK